MPGRDITAIEFAQKVGEVKDKLSSSQSCHRPAQEIVRQWSFMAPSRHFFIEEPEIRRELLQALDTGAAVCELALLRGEGNGKELSMWRNDLTIDAATHRLAGDEQDEVAKAAQVMDKLVTISPNDFVMERGKLSDDSPLPILARLSAAAMRLYGDQKLAQMNGEDKDPAPAIEALLHETIDHQNQLIEIISQTGKMPEVSAIAAGALFRLLHFSNLLVQWYHSPSPDPRLIRFGLLREHRPGKKRSPQDIFNIAELTTEGRRLLRIRIKPFGPNDGAVEAITSRYAMKEVSPLQQKAERVRKLLKHAVDPEQTKEKQQEAMEGLATYLGEV